MRYDATYNDDMNMKQIDAFVRDACITYINKNNSPQDHVYTRDECELSHVNDATYAHRIVRMYMLTIDDDDAIIVAHITKIDDDEYVCDMITYEFDCTIVTIYNDTIMFPKRIVNTLQKFDASFDTLRDTIAKCCDVDVIDVIDTYKYLRTYASHSCNA